MSILERANLLTRCRLCECLVVCRRPPAICSCSKAIADKQRLVENKTISAKRAEELQGRLCQFREKISLLHFFFFFTFYSEWTVSIK